MRCSFGSLTVNESVSPGRIGKSPVRRQPEHERFHKDRDYYFDRPPPNSFFLQRSFIPGVYAPL